MITDKQEQILAKLFKKPKKHYISEEEYDKMGIYGENYCHIEYDEYFEEEDEEEDDGNW